MSFNISGKLRGRFIENAVLLRALEPVRGESSIYGLDQDVKDSDRPRDHALKIKFLESFALVCATKRNGDTVSAAVLEEGRPEGTVLRIAINAGVSSATLNDLQNLIALLDPIVKRASSASLQEPKVLPAIIRLDLHKIRGYINKLRGHRGDFESSIRTVQEESSLGIHEQFLEWAANISPLFDLPDQPEPDTLIRYIRHARRARKDYEQIFETFRSQSQPLPLWIMLIYKLGRYGIASNVFVLTASELPDLFSPMSIEAVTASIRTQHDVSKDVMPLTTVLRRVVGNGFVPQYLSSLSTIWNKPDVESYFRSLCNMSLLAHAEMQLVSFYDQSLDYQPKLKYIGVSKKTCYLCHSFLSFHPGSFSVSSCHQKLYLPWIPPPVDDTNVYRQNREIIADMNKLLERSLTAHLQSRLGMAGRAFPLDSTAGVSLPTMSRALAVQPMAIQPESQHNFIDTGSLDGGVSILVQPVDMGSRFDGSSILSRQDRQGQDYQQLTTSEIVFLITRDGDPLLQDIIQVADVLDDSTGKPSWNKFLDLLRVDDDFGLAFNDDRDFL